MVGQSGVLADGGNARDASGSGCGKYLRGEVNCRVVERTDLGLMRCCEEVRIQDQRRGWLWSRGSGRVLFLGRVMPRPNLTTMEHFPGFLTMTWITRKSESTNQRVTITYPHEGYQVKRTADLASSCLAGKRKLVLNADWPLGLAPSSLPKSSRKMLPAKPRRRPNPSIATRQKWLYRVHMCWLSGRHVRDHSHICFIILTCI